MMNTTERIRCHARHLSVGQPVSIQQFMAFGSRAAVDQTLGRLVKEGLLTRPARGVYVRPRHSAHVGPVPPEPIQIAQTVAAESGYKVQVHGAEAVRRLGLSTQVPTKPVFYTSGPSRSFRMGSTTISLKHVSPRKIALAGRPAGIALTALWYLGKEKVNTETIEHIHSRLAPEEFEALRSEVSAMPGWMRKAMLEYTERSHLFTMQ